MNNEKRKLTQKEKDIFIIIVTLLLMAFFLSLNAMEKYEEKKNAMEESLKTTLVVDATRYFTVLGCAKKFINYVQTGSDEEILAFLDKDYMTTLGITLDNVGSFVPSLDSDGMYDYEGKEMYQKRISENVIEYYLKGRIKNSPIEGAPTSKDYNMTIILFENKGLFAIKPGIGGIS